MTRPPTLPEIASVDVFTSPGDLWHNQPTKLEPSAGIIAAGAQPAEPLPADIVNWQDNLVSRWVRHFDLIEVTNYPEPAPDVGAVGGTGTAGNAGGLAWLQHDLRRPICHVNGDADIRASLDGGITWASTSPGYTDAGAAFRDIAASETATVAIAEEGGATKAVCSTALVGFGVGTTVALTSGSLAKVVVFDPYYPGDHVFWIGGESGGTAPRIWQLKFGAAGTTNPPAQTIITVSLVAPFAVAGTCVVSMIACGADYIMAACKVASTDAMFRCTRSGGDTFTEVDRPADNVLDLLWVPAQGLQAGVFLAFTATNVYRSTTGASASWTTLTQPSGMTWIDRSGLVWGSCILMLASSGGLYYLGISRDVGQTWHFIPSPLNRHQGTAVPTGGIIRRTGARVAVAGRKGAAAVYMAFGFRVGDGF